MVGNHSNRFESLHTVAVNFHVPHTRGALRLAARSDKPKRKEEGCLW